jgi:class 3 adenylate cyclase
MATKAVLEAQVRAILATAENWDVENARVIPTPIDVALTSGHAKFFKTATVLYADLDGSTDMVNSFRWWFAAEVYKAYLSVAGRVIKDEGGTITAYDGDRIMAMFIGDTQKNDAVRAAMKIKWAVTNIINPAIKAKWPKVEFVLKQVIGIDASPIHAVRIGVHRDNDLVWVGRAANYAAKLCAADSSRIWITSDVYDGLDANHRNSGEVSMWTKWGKPWAATPKHSIDGYSTTYSWTIGG